MGIKDREYMKEGFKPGRRKDSIPLWIRLRFFLWDLFIRRFRR